MWAREVYARLRPIRNSLSQSEQGRLIVPIGLPVVRPLMACRPNAFGANDPTGAVDHAATSPKNRVQLANSTGSNFAVHPIAPTPFALLLSAAPLS